MGHFCVKYVVFFQNEHIRAICWTEQHSEYISDVAYLHVAVLSCVDEKSVRRNVIEDLKSICRGTFPFFSVEKKNTVSESTSTTSFMI